MRTQKTLSASALLGSLRAATALAATVLFALHKEHCACGEKKRKRPVCTVLTAWREIS